MLDYQLIDSGNRQRLEKWGQVLTIKPDPTANWAPTLPSSAWQKAQAIFQSESGKTGQGHWQFSADLPSTWQKDGFPISGQLLSQFSPLQFQLKFMPSKHLGLFPEHESQWLDLQKQISSTSSSPPFRVLNLFAFTGAASLACAQAGAQVTHVDSSYEAIGLARQSQALSGLQDAPIRWIKEDVSKFVAREIRRQSQYEGIILDPPAFGHGARGETWQTARDLPQLLTSLQKLLSPRASFFLLNTYALQKTTADQLIRPLLAQFQTHFTSYQSGQLTLQPSTPGSHPLTTGDFNFFR